MTSSCRTLPCTNYDSIFPKVSYPRNEATCHELFTFDSLRKPGTIRAVCKYKNPQTNIPVLILFDIIA